MIISINGLPGAGKSMVVKKIAQKLKWRCYNMGELRRRTAKKKGLTLSEYNKLGETDSLTDKEIDEIVIELGKTNKNIIIDSRTAWHFIPKSLKIFLTVDEKIGAKRIFKELENKDNRNEDDKLITLGQTLKSINFRSKSDTKRYKKYYNIDVFNKKHYDFIVDTTKLNKKQVFDKIYKYIQLRLKTKDNIDRN